MGLVAKQSIIYWTSLSLLMSERILIYQMQVLELYTKEENIPEIISPGYVSLTKKKIVNCDSTVS